MTRLTYIAFCWMLFICVMAAGILGYAVAHAILFLLGPALGISPVATAGILAFLAMTGWSAYRLATH